MIDNEKLKIAYELLKKYRDINNDYCFIDLKINLYSDGYEKVIWRVYIEGLYSEDYDSLEPIIERIQKLTITKPKFKVGQLVWIFDEGLTQISFQIKKIEYKFQKIVYLFEKNYYADEEECYETKNQLIRAKIKVLESELDSDYENKND